MCLEDYSGEFSEECPVSGAHCPADVGARLISFFQTSLLALYTLK